MRIASVAEIKARFSAYVKESERGPVVVTRNGRPVAVLLAMEDEDELERLLLAHSPRLRAILDASRAQVAEGRGLGHDELWAAVEPGPRPRRRPRTPAKRSSPPQAPSPASGSSSAARAARRSRES